LFDFICNIRDIIAGYVFKILIPITKNIKKNGNGTEVSNTIIRVISEVLKLFGDKK